MFHTLNLIWGRYLHSCWIVEEFHVDFGCLPWSTLWIGWACRTYLSWRHCHIEHYSDLVGGCGWWYYPHCGSISHRRHEFTLKRTTCIGGRRQEVVTKVLILMESRSRLQVHIIVGVGDINQSDTQGSRHHIGLQYDLVDVSDDVVDGDRGEIILLLGGSRKECTSKSNKVLDWFLQLLQSSTQNMSIRGSLDERTVHSSTSR